MDQDSKSPPDQPYRSTVISIRPLTAGDEPILWEFIYHAVHVPADQPPPPRDHPPAGNKSVRRRWGRPEDEGVVAYDGESPIGAAWLRLLTGTDKGYGYVDDDTPELTIAVAPGHRGQGVGSRMLTALLEGAGSRYPAVSLSVTADNPAGRLYHRLGFVVVREAGSSLTMIRRRGP